MSNENHYTFIIFYYCVQNKRCPTDTVHLRKINIYQNRLQKLGNVLYRPREGRTWVLPRAPKCNKLDLLCSGSFGGERRTSGPGITGSMPSGATVIIKNHPPHWIPDSAP